jgi:hypothetical protein
MNNQQILEYLRFIQRVLESNAPDQDKLEARKKVIELRKHFFNLQLIELEKKRI